MITRFFAKSVAAFFIVISVNLSLAAFADDICVTQWGSSLTGLPYVVALDKGLFRKYGVNVTGIVGSNGGGSTIRDILASPLPYGEVSLDAAVAAKQRGLDIVIVNVGTRRVPGSSIVSLDPSIHSLKDLTGKKVAITTPGSVSEMVLILGLRQEGLNTADVQRVSAGGYMPGLTMLDHGAVAAAPLFEPLSLYQWNKYKVVADLMKILPPMVGTVGVTTSIFAKAHPETIRAIIAAREAAVRSIYANPEAALTSLSKSQPIIYQSRSLPRRLIIWSRLIL
jgi:NitT/TauT family transport system substrate-binding protein